jgi:methionine-rich copper-binding protein CopC
MGAITALLCLSLAMITVEAAIAHYTVSFGNPTKNIVCKTYLVTFTWQLAAFFKFDMFFRSPFFDCKFKN